MDIGKSFSYPFEDDEWLSKFFIGAIVNAIPILNFAFTGYTVDIVRNVSDGVSLPLPDWKEFGDKFVKGFLVWAAGFIYGLPAIIIACLPLGLLAIPLALEGSDLSDSFFSVFAGVNIFLICLLAIYMLLLSFYLPAMYINFARKGNFGSCFEIREIFRIISANTGQYLTAWLIFIVGGIVVSLIIGIVGSVLSIIPCIGWIIGWVVYALGTVYILAVGAHLFGQVGAVQPPPAAITETEE
jgi:hypothetical protein